MGAPPAEPFLSLVAHPQRWALLQALADSDRRVGELSTLVDERQNLVSYHLAELRRAGLVSSRRSAADGRDTYYRLHPDRCADGFARAAAALHPGVRLDTSGAAFAVARRRTPRVLFVCTGNSIRSQLAEALLRHHAGGTVDACSAGTQPTALHPEAVRVLSDRGVDMTGHAAKPVAAFAHERMDHVITLCDRAREVCPELPNRPATAHWSIADPSTGDGSLHDRIVRTADEIDERVQFLLARLHAHPRHTTRKEST